MKPILIPLLALFIFPIAFAEDRCKEMSDIVQHYERLIQWKSVEEIKDGERKDCTPAMSTQLIQENLKKIKTEFDTDQTGKLNQYACASLATLETRIAELENEASLLSGFHKLKADLKENQKKADDPSKKVALMAGLSFVNGLNAAENLELMLADNGNMLKAIHGMEPAKRADPKQVKEFVLKQCAPQPKIGICAPKAFDPNATAMAAISELLKDKPSDEQIASWISALSIEKEGGGRWSFKDMASELRANLGDIEQGKLNLTEKQLKAIRALEKFKDGGPLNLANMKKDIKIYDLMQEYKFHMSDLKQRQHYEIQSKAVLAYADVKALEGGVWVAKLTPEQKKACDGSKSDKTNAMACFDALEQLGGDKKFNQTHKSRIHELATAAKVSSKWLEQMDIMHNLCMDVLVNEEFKHKAELPENCKGALESTDSELARIQSDLLVLNALKSEIENQNQDDIKVRNLVLATLMNNKDCSKQQEIFRSTLSCTQEKLTIAPSVDVLTSNVLDVMVIQKDPKASVDNKWLCENSEIKAYKKHVICGTKAETPQLPPKKSDDYQAPLSPPDDGRNSPATDATINGLGMLAGTALGGIFAPQPSNNYYPPYNPYMYNYNNYNYGYPVMGISDQIIFDARYYGGYGQYWSTPGTMPYSSFGSMDSYTPYSSTKSAYFGR